MVTKTFQRTKYWAYVKLGAGQKSKRRYKKPTGRHNKSRQKWRSRPPMVEIGYKNQVSTSGMINEKKPVMVYNLKDLGKIGKDNIAVLAKIGNKLKLEIAREASAKKIEVYNLNLKKFIKAMERKIKSKSKEIKKEEKK